jgi:hypothetical protein
MSHMVSNVPLVAQTQEMGCWYACLEMLVRWHRRTYGWSPGEPAIDAPHFERSSQRQGRPAASGLGMAQAPDPRRDLIGGRSNMDEAVRSVGLTPVRGTQVADPTAAEVERWLQCFGPILVNGYWIDLNGRRTNAAHVVLLVGIEDNPGVGNPARAGSRHSLIVHNPEPVNRGSREQRPFEWLAQTLTPRMPVSLAYYRPEPGAACGTQLLTRRPA